MKFHFYILSLVLLIQPLIATSQSANCQSDSTVAMYSFYDYFDQHSPPSQTMTVNHYNLDFGIVTNQFGEISFWQKTDTVFTQSGALDSIITLTGSLNGWIQSYIRSFQYSPTGKCNAVLDLSYSNNTWDTIEWHTYEYDILDRPITEDFKSKSNNVWTYNHKLVYDYTPDAPYSTTLLKGNQQTWQNDSMFVYGYSNGIRSNLSISVWDTTNLNWRLVDQGNFSSTPNGWLATIYVRERVYYNGSMPSSEIYYEYDTLDRMMHYREQLTPFDTTFSGTTSYELSYGIFNDQRCLTTKILGENWVFDPLDSNLYLSYEYFTINYHYDSLAHFLGSYSSGWAGGFHEQILSYDSLGNLVHFYDHYENHSGQSWETTDTFYFYSNPNTLSFCILPDFNTNTSSCPSGSIAGSNLIAIGGCGPITYEWLPNIPTINTGGVHSGVIVQDTASYILVAHDQSGLTDTTTFTTNPAGSRPLLHYLPVCTGGYQLSLDPSGTPPNWYSYTTLFHNDTLVSYYIDTISAPGDYYVTINYEDFHCIQYSDTISIITTYDPLQVTAGSDTAFCAGQSIILGGSPTASGGSSPITYQWSPAAGLSSATVANPAVTLWTSTPFQLTVTDSVGCTSVTQVSIVVGDTTTPDLDLINGWLITEPGATLYQWYYNGQLLAASSNLSQLAALSGGDYQVILTDFIGCTRSTPVYHYSSTGLYEALKLAVRIYPNPVLESFSIDLPATLEKAVSYRLCDYLGRVVMCGNWHSTHNTIDMTGYPNGLYSLVFTDINGETGKIVVAKGE